ncbi:MULTISPECIES: TetR family transcriptional regulator [unclassified Streptomyces]|uniref:TetR/AcrR family transcriptional regulator n=1 Tax=unclassified Streptomyces TaxID=2593676 RepID=UPI0033BD30A8
MPERTERPGLRERKKEETRRGLREAAGRLFAERGFAQTTVADIAAEANVSERTFFRYFDSKEALLLPDGIELFARIEEAFLARPDGDTPLEAACGAITDAVSYFASSSLTALAHPLGEIREQAREGLSRQFQQFEARLTALVLERLPADAPDADLQAAVIANCALSAARAVLRTLRDRRTAGVPVEPDRLLPQAFTFLTMIGATSS